MKPFNPKLMKALIFIVASYFCLTIPFTLALAEGRSGYDQFGEYVEKSIISRSGKKLPTAFHSICLHSDTPNSVEISNQICILLRSMGVQQQTLPELF